MKVKTDIKKSGIKKCARESGFTCISSGNYFVDCLLKRNSYNDFVRWFQSYKSKENANS